MNEMDRTLKRSKVSLLMEVMHDPHRKPVWLILKELLKLLIIHKEIPGHYFSGYLFKSTVDCPENFIPIRRARKIVPGLNDRKLKEVLDNKLYFNLFYGQFGIDIPEVVMFNHGSLFGRGSESFEVRTKDEFSQRLRELFHQFPSPGSVIIKKIYASSKGSDIYKLKAEEIDIEPDKVSMIFQRIRSSEFLFQKTIIQHHILNLLNPSSVNTLRIDTLLDAHGRAQVLSGYLRMSLGNHFVDNIGSGGCMVSVDLDTGRLNRYARSDFNYYGVELLTEHPVTGTIFDGFQLPFIEEVKDLVSRAAELMPGLRIVGWDVAISETGPIIVEGNSDYGIRGNDLAYGGYLAHPVLKEVLKEANL